MRSLSTHLRAPEDHARLPFHPDCPVCRSERLTGVLSSEGVVSLRTQAALAAGVLALSALAPAAVLAAEPDQMQEGAAAPGQVGNSDTAASPDFDPGGASTDLPGDAPPVPQLQAPPAASNDDAAPLDQEPAKDVDAPVADAGDDPAEPSAQQQGAPLTQPAPPAPDVPAPPASPAPTAKAPPAPTAAPGSPSTEAGSQFRARKRRDAAQREAGQRDVARARQVARPPAPGHASGGAANAPSSATGVPLAQARPTPSVAVAVGDGDAAEPGDRTHVARPGESLWSIATDVLGGTASTAQLAREVNRLWELNKDRVGTGDPDLLMIGTRLRLR